MLVSRRNFLLTSATAVAVGLSVPPWFSKMIWAGDTAAASPVAGAPSDNPTAKVPYRADGKAAIVRNIQTYGNAALATPATTIHLAYDEEALYVAAILDESEAGYPLAYPRRPTDDLTLDDAFQVVLGMADPANVNREILRMGGYAGALDAKIASADYYYQFTVNAVGAQSRTFNETPLKRPLFTSAVGRVSGGWQVTMKIPFSSLGLGSPVGQTLFANFFRFRPPAITAWTLPSFGGYSGMPFGTLEFLPPGAGQSPAVEPEAATIAASSLPALPPARPISEMKAQLQGALEYYPLSGAVVGRISHPANPSWTDAKAVLVIDNQAQAPQSLSTAENDLVIARIPPGSQAERQATLRIVGPDGSVLLENSQTFAAVAAPVWFGAPAGRSYLTEKIPAPWTAPQIRGNEVTLAHCKINFSRFGLFSSVYDDLGELLAGDGEIEVLQGVRALHFTPVKETLSKDGNYVIANAINTAGDANLEVRSTVDYDGFTVVTMRLLGIAPETISRITVRLPIESIHAQFVQKLLVQEIKALNEFGYTAKEGPLWVGDQDKGIRLSYDIDPFLSINPRSRIRVVRNGIGVALEFDLVDQAGQVLEDGHVFRFFLQPTPTKPRLMQQAYSLVRFQWEQWADHQGEIELSKAPAIKTWTEQLARQGLIGAVYTCQGLAEDTPGFQEYRPDLEIQPSWMFYRRGYNPGLNVPCFATCKRGPDGDRVLYGLQKMIVEANIGGICDDGMSIAWGDANPAHEDGCGAPLKVTWDESADSLYPAQRNFLKRLRGIFNERGGPFLLTAHTGGGLDIATLSFFDGYMEGEQLARFRPGYHIPLSTFAVGYNGQSWGFRTRFWDKTWRRQQGRYWSYAYVFLFGTDYEDSMDPYQVLKEFQDKAETVFHPYWRPGPHVKLASSQSLVSYFRKNEAALVTVANMNYGEDSVALDLQRLFPGRQIVVYNILAASAVVPLQQGMVLRRTLPGWQCAVFRVEVKNSALSDNGQGWRETGLQPAHWSLADSHNGAALQVKSGAAGAPDSMEVTSTLYQDEARLRFSRETGLPVASGRLLVRHSGRLCLRFGDAAITCDSGWSTSGLDGGMLFQPMLSTQKPVLIEFSINAGVLQAAYDQKPLAAGMRLTPKEGSDFCLSTWAGDSLSVQPIEMGSQPSTIYEPLEGVYQLTNTPAPEAFAIASYHAEDWAFSTVMGGSRTETTLMGDPAVKITSASNADQAQVTLIPHVFGEDGAVSLSVQHSGRLRISIGSNAIFYDGGSWQILGDPSGWSKALLYQPSAILNAPTLLTVVMKEGVWTVLQDDHMILRDASFADRQKGGNALTVSTWAGDEATFSVKNIASMPLVLPSEAIQPVL